MELGSLHPIAHAQPPAPATGDARAETRRNAEPPAANARGPSRPDGERLSEDQQKQLEALKARDRDVRAHERAHAAAAGSLARGGPSYSTQRGPDGRWYAVGGEVQIDTSAVPGDPHATLRKAQQIQRAAMAPATPSAQDRAVAASAAAMAAQARMAIAAEGLQSEPAEGTGADAPPADAAPGESGSAPCPACGARHGASAPNGALAQHFANAVTPREPSGALISSVV